MVWLIVAIFQHMGSREDVEARINADTTQKIEAMKHQVAASKDKVWNIKKKKQIVN